MNELYQLHRIHNGDGLLHGFSTEVEGALALHVHGTWGNFYENPFVLELSPVYHQCGYRYASTNNPGHDSGSMHEVFETSLPAIENWITALTSPDDDSLVLQGHSLGALKILKLMTSDEYVHIQRRVRAIVLLAPFDLVAFYGGDSRNEIDRRRSIATDAAVSKGADSLIDPSVFDSWPVSISTFLAATEIDGPWDLFPTRQSSIGALSQIGVPTFVAVGADDFAATPTPHGVAELWKGAPNVRGVLIDGAPHNFAGTESMLGEEIRKFLSELPQA